MAARSHLAIGEVLGLLQEEFPDVTISKIRFLESQGLLDPERTPSGYRKFYDADIDRLRWILRQQRDQFLPLRVIKARLDEVTGGAVGAAEEQLAPEAVAAPPVTAPTDHPADPGPGQVAPPAPEPGPGPAPQVHVGPESTPARPDPAPPVDASPDSTPGPHTPARPGPEPPPASGVATPEPALRSSPLAVPPEAPSPARERPTAAPPVAEVPDASDDDVALTPAELAAACGLAERDVEQLVQYGLIRGVDVGREVVFGGESVAVARLAAAFGRYGVEPRHLRMYKTFADREVAVFEQLVTPLLRQRNASARRLGSERFEDLADLGADLRAALLRQAGTDLLP